MIRHILKDFFGLIKYLIKPRHVYFRPNVENKFVAVWILGGVGNQLFQFATAYALSQENGFQLILDRNFKGYFREEALRTLGINFLDWEGPRPSVDKYDVQNAPYKIFVEKDFSYDSSIWDIKDSCYLYGYWSSPKYFKKYSIDIKKLISFEHVITARISDLISKLGGSNTVSLHLRRGDYNTPEGIASFGLLGIDYYERARDLLLRSIPNATFFIFSDDVAIAKEMFQSWGNCVFVNTNSALEDLYLMTLAQNHIIANSTFSWWGAYLSNYDEGIKIAPRHWFTKEATIRHKYLLDLFPDDWIQL
jgi:hypothetical protein